MDQPNTPNPPKFYNQFKEKFPEVSKKYEELGETIHNLGPLSDRERALVKLAISGSHLYHSAFKAHVRKGVALGLTRAEIEQVALLMLPTLGYPTSMAVMGFINDQFDVKGME